MQSASSSAATCRPKFVRRSALSAKEKYRSQSRSSHNSPASRSLCSRSGGPLRLASTSWTVSAGQRSTRSVMSLATARRVMEVVNNDRRPSRQLRGIVRDRRDDIGRHHAVHREQVCGIAAESRSTARGAWMKPVQNRTASASAPSHDSQKVTPRGRVAAQLDSSTLLPVPADPTTTVRRWPAPAVSRSCSIDRVTSVAGSVGGRNFVSANRTPCDALRSAVASSAT